MEIKWLFGRVVHSTLLTPEVLASGKGDQGAVAGYHENAKDVVDQLRH